MSQFKNDYLGYNENRIYSIGDKIIKYNSCATKIILYVCISQNATGEFDSHKWAKVEEENTMINLCQGYKADYLGSCAKNIILRESKINNLIIEEEYKIPIFENPIWFDNFTFIS